MDVHLQRAAARSARRGGAGLRERGDPQRERALPAVHAQDALHHLRGHRLRRDRPVGAAGRTRLPGTAGGRRPRGTRLGRPGHLRPRHRTARGRRTPPAGSRPQTPGTGPPRPCPRPTVPQRGHPVRRRTPAHPARRPAQHRTQRHHLRARRTGHRPPPRRQGPSAGHGTGAARRREHRAAGRARPGAHRPRRLGDRHGTRCRTAGRRGARLRHPGGAATSSSASRTIRAVPARRHHEPGDVVARTIRHHT
ncbi:hypothetical protein STREPTOSP366_00660 [Streptomyces variabilis]